MSYWIRRLMSAVEDGGGKGPDDAEVIDLGEGVKLTRKDARELHGKSANLEKDYTQKTQQLAKDKATLDKQFGTLKSIKAFEALMDDDPEEAERQFKKLIKKGVDDGDEGEDKGKKKPQSDRFQRQMESTMAQMHRKLEISELRADDPIFKEHEKSVVEYADESGISLAIALKAWKTDNAELLAKNKAEAEKKAGKKPVDTDDGAPPARGDPKAKVDVTGKASDDFKRRFPELMRT